jgi:hypothetical protein
VAGAVVVLQISQERHTSISRNWPSKPGDLRTHSISLRTHSKQTDIQERVKHVKSDLEVAGNIEQQHQPTEIQAEQELRTEQDKLSALEAQSDELIRSLGNPVEQSGPNRP